MCERKRTLSQQLLLAQYICTPPKKGVTHILKKARTVDSRFHPNMKATLTIAP